jgi:hypothetical protein
MLEPAQSADKAIVTSYVANISAALSKVIRDVY